MEMRSKKTVDYRKVERDELVQMVAEEPVKYGNRCSLLAGNI